MRIKIKKESNIPAYRQIVGQIQSAIQAGKLQAGYKLPTERELAKSCNLARGTIKKAYETLEKERLVQVIRGSGTFVAGVSEIQHATRKVSALSKIEALFDELLDRGLSITEIKNLFYLMAYQRERQMEAFHIAAVDCNPEALSIYEKQLLFLSKKRVYKIPLTDLRKQKNPSATLREYDLIITTTNHIDELEKLIPELNNKLLKASVSPSQKTVVDIASIHKKSRIGIVSISEKFSRVIRDRLLNFQLNEQSVMSLVQPSDEELISLLEKSDALIMPPDYPLNRNRHTAAAINRFRDRGGRLIEFEYRIEQGTLDYIEDRIAKIFQGE